MITLVVSSPCIFLEGGSAYRLLNSIMEHTSPGGINLLIGFTNVGDFQKNPIAKTKLYPQKDYILELYKNNGFEVLKYNTKMGLTKSGEQQEKFFLLTRKN
ncbi:MAG: hypothetical protein UU80_C0005G0010 [candidate division WWE3 bacterium GW2011_GWA1_41_8]|uniref:Tellurite resistance methyltransferase TehB-like domain-containing protein n=3 Tax=Katanobacteria TaxID=422282 RepID=A0A0G0XCF3_UNCKA|nr:MAG: hypothetical protein UU72_C0020G0004 [candidate division WWE3 bacterium GW2011_GWB1_41_6]KKS22565.1 MAG: hypothetical protein UU80_C0005G0010 [candidate division WWE3 bacterium GW2011_GWA1_41_8]OGC58316.1 MAG: hypothetical protein A2976_03095 [candidate division WWE3 bacterium RIFCSPLOWO2_01_FULL_41_9]